MDFLIKNATIVNEGAIKVASLHIKEGRIARIAPWDELKALAPKADGQLDIFASGDEVEVVDASGKLLLPGVIDTHVHFREPGLTEKADFYTESRAAAAGGVTSVVDMPNTKPQTTTMALLDEKKRIAQEKSLVNYGFMLGATNGNIDELLQANPKEYAAIKLFLGSSTGNMLVNDPERLDHLFEHAKKLIVAHCEEESIVQGNNKNAQLEYKGTDKETAALHPKIRTTEACFVSTYKAIERARKYGTRLHISHVSTATELDLLSNQELDEKHVTAEVTPNHLWFDDRDYAELGNKIKCNPAIKSNDDRLALWAGLYDGLLDTIGTDHAPHTLESKQQPYFDAPGGIPSIQHSLTMMLEPCIVSNLDGGETESLLPLVVEKMCHAPARLFGIKERGYIREGYHADLVMVDPGKAHTVKQEDLLYKCGWSPLEGQTFHSKVEKTWVNGQLAWDGKVVESKAAMALEFEK